MTTTHTVHIHTRTYLRIRPFVVLLVRRPTPGPSSRCLTHLRSLVAPPLLSIPLVDPSPPAPPTASRAHLRAGPSLLSADHLPRHTVLAPSFLLLFQIPLSIPLLPHSLPFLACARCVLYNINDAFLRPSFNSRSPSPPFPFDPSNMSMLRLRAPSRITYWPFVFFCFLPCVPPSTVYSEADIHI